MTPQPFGHLRTHSGEALATSSGHGTCLQSWDLQYTKMIQNGQTEFQQKIKSTLNLQTSAKKTEDTEGLLRHRFEWWMWSRLCGSKPWTIGVVPWMSAVDPWRWSANGQSKCPQGILYRMQHGRESIAIPPLGMNHPAIPAIPAILGFTRIGLWFDGLLLRRQPSLRVASKACFFVDVKGLFETISSGFLQTRGM